PPPVYLGIRHRHRPGHHAAVVDRADPAWFSRPGGQHRAAPPVERLVITAESGTLRDRVSVPWHPDRDFGGFRRHRALPAGAGAGEIVELHRVAGVDRRRRGAVADTL